MISRRLVPLTILFFAGVAGRPALAQVTVFDAPPLPSLSPVSLAPPVSAGRSQTLTATFINSAGGYRSLDVLNVLVNDALDGRRACYLAYSVPSNTLWIVPDNGDATQLSGKVMDGTGTVGNSQCTVALSGSSATGHGDLFTLTLNITFSQAFPGSKVIYVAARDIFGNNSGWQSMGVIHVPLVLLTDLFILGMDPPFGSSLAQTITFSYYTEFSPFQTVWALINSAVDGRGACYIAYYRPGNLLFLAPDSGEDTQANGMVLGSNNTISNSQCTVSGQGASVQMIGNTLSVTLPITFKPAFAGFRVVWLGAATLDNRVVSWQAFGAEALPSQ
jgi:hypothetical protein